MRIILRRALSEFWERYSDAEQPLRAWYASVRCADWTTPSTPSDVKTAYRNASFVQNNRVIFNIKGNSYRLVAAINYQYRIDYIPFVGTLQVYDRIHPATI